MLNSSKERASVWLDTANYFIFLLGIIGLPFFTDRRLTNFYIIPKQYALLALVLAAIIIFLTRSALSKTIQFRYTVIDGAIGAFVLVMLLASVFSAAPGVSFFGRPDYFGFNWLLAACLALWYWWGLNTLTTVKRWQAAYRVIVMIGGLTALFFILHSLFRINLFSWLFPIVTNTIDPSNGLFGLWMIGIFVLSAGVLIKKQAAPAWVLLYFLTALLSATALLLISFKLLWWLLLGALLLLLFLGISFIHQARLGWLSTLFAFLVLVIVFIVFDTPRALQRILPVEVYLGAGPSWVLTKQAIFAGAKNVFLGTGPGTFAIDFSQFRTAEFNTDTQAWSLRFTQPFNSLLAMLAETGALGLFALVIILLLALGQALAIAVKFKKQRWAEALWQRWLGRESDASWEALLVAIACAVVGIGLVFVFFGPLLWWYWWMLLSLLMAGLSFWNESLFRNRRFTIEASPQYHLASAFTLIVLIVGVVLIGVGSGRMYAAEVAYATGLRSADTNQAEAQFKKALQYREIDLYHVALAQLYLSRATAESRVPKPSVDTISGLMAQAVNEARRATDLSPRSVAIWENLALMYDNAAALVPEAREWALKSLLEAKRLEPTNPVLFWRLGLTYAALGKTAEAAKHLEEAINLKRDYLAAYGDLARVYEESGQIDRAVELYKTVALVNVSNMETLFNYGRLLYNRNRGDDRKIAEELWLEAVRREPQFSNALYGLGFLYEAKGDKAKALQYYYKVKDLNPENADLTKKIKALVGGR